MKLRLVVTTAVLAVLFTASAFAKDVKTEIKVSGMTCGGCAVSVKSALLKVKGVKSADVSYEKALASVVYEDTQTDEQQLRDAINKTGFKAEPAKESKK